MIDLSKRELECIDLELQRYRTIKNRIYLRRQELIHSNSNNFTNATFGKEKKGRETN
ncbi:hypothetical protein MX035_05625 [Streptococcus uberis]|nr:hypothetical protein [Streptococcus uberis]MCK1246875.1 hypothetical protein [Streptococcus uberis]